MLVIILSLRSNFIDLTATGLVCRCQIWLVFALIRDAILFKENNEAARQTAFGWT
jgi:hypothetical protein